MERRGRRQLDIALLAQFARKRCQQCFALFDATSWQMPSGNIGVLDQEDATVRVQNQAADAEGKPSRKSPISVEKRANKRLQPATDETQRHTAIRLRSGLASPIRMALK